MRIRTTEWILFIGFLIQISFQIHPSSRLLRRWWARKRDIFRLVRNQPHHPQDTGGQTVPGPELRCPCIPLHPLWPLAPSERPHTETNPTTDAEQRGLCVHGQHATGPCLSGHLGRLRGPERPAAVWDPVQRTGQLSGPGVLGGRLPEHGAVWGSGPVRLSVEEYHPPRSRRECKPVCGLQPDRQLHPGRAVLRAPAGWGKPHVRRKGVQPREPLQGETLWTLFCGYSQSQRPERLYHIPNSATRVHFIPTIFSGDWSCQSGWLVWTPVVFLCGTESKFRHQITPCV